MRQKITGRDDGFTLVELLIVVAIIGILGAIGSAQLIKARASGNESAAISSLRAIATSQVSYAQSCGRNAYATGLTMLGAPAPGEPPFLSPDLTGNAVVVKSGYEFVLTAGAFSSPGIPDCNGAPTADDFYATARPVTFDVSGARSFAVGVSGTIWQTLTAAPPTEPFGPPAEPIK